MHPLPKSTAKILAYKVLDQDFDKTWVDWSIEMLNCGFETEYLVILAGMSDPFDYFEMESLTTKVLNELGLDYSNKLQTIWNYVKYLIQLYYDGEIESIDVLNEVKDLYIQLDYGKSLRRFYFLYYAKTDLMIDEIQWYIDGVDRSNIDETIVDYFNECLPISKT